MDGVAHRISPTRRPGPRPGAGRGGRHAGGRGRRGRGRRRRRGPGEHEDGNRAAAPFAGRVREVLVAVNVQVDAGAPLLRFEPVDDGDGAPAGRGSSFADSTCRAAPAADERQQRPARGLAELRALILGYDVTPSDGGRERWPSTSGTRRAVATTRHSSQGELGLLERLRRPVRAVPQPAARRRGHRRDARAQPARALPLLPAFPRRRAGGAARAFRAQLARALRHYGVDEPRPHRRRWRRPSTGCSSPCSARRPTSRWSSRCSSAGSTDADAADGCAERSARCSTGWSLATQVRYPVVGDLARSVRFRWFDEPLIEAARERGLRQRARAAALPGRPTPTRPDRDERDRGAGRNPRAAGAAPGRAHRAAAAASRRARGARAPVLPRSARSSDLATRSAGGRPFVTADYTLDGEPHATS